MTQNKTDLPCQLALTTNEKQGYHAKFKALSEKEKKKFKATKKRAKQILLLKYLLVIEN